MNTSQYEAVRAHTLALCEPLAIEDYVPQPIAEVSPPKWHLGHTTWFFESIVLNSPPVDKAYAFLFNSYYEGLGERVERAFRGALSRPTVAEITAYRARIDEAVREAVAQSRVDLALLELGCHHEQQHQELLVADIKYLLGINPIEAPYVSVDTQALAVTREHVPQSNFDWVQIDEGLALVGNDASSFCFDNETPRHRVVVQPAQLRAGLVTNGEFVEFIEAGGYQQFEFWHSDGWQWLKDADIRAPLYWKNQDGVWTHYTLTGRQPIDIHAPVTHVSYFEAYAWCQWRGWRLPTEFEWEVAAPRLDWGQRWEWTESSYDAYPGFVPRHGAVREYNGKFMVNQKTLRGASFATPPGHSRITYRNFFHPHECWQYTGIRPARSTR